VARAEVAHLRDDMYRYPLRLALEAAFAGHPYGRSATGTDAALAALKTIAPSSKVRPQPLRSTRMTQNTSSWKQSCRALSVGAHDHGSQDKVK
jgi:hypothetical protein